jgi:hypothetical protein
VESFHFEYDDTNKILAVRVAGPMTDDVFRTMFASMTRQVEGREIPGPR